jgi:hypothetical protein
VIKWDSDLEWEDSKKSLYNLAETLMLMVLIITSFIYPNYLYYVIYYICRYWNKNISIWVWQSIKEVDSQIEKVKKWKVKS